MNLYEISAVIDIIRHDGIVDLPAIEIVNKTIKVLGYKGKFGLHNGRIAYMKADS